MAIISCNLAPTTIISDEELTFNDSNVWSSFAKPLIMIFWTWLDMPMMSNSLSFNCLIVDDGNIETVYLILLCITTNLIGLGSLATTFSTVSFFEPLPSSSLISSAKLGFPKTSNNISNAVHTKGTQLGNILSTPISLTGWLHCAIQLS